MLNLMKSEIRKILSSKLFYIMLILFFILFLRHFENPDKYFSYYIRSEKNFAATAVGHTILFTRNSVIITILSVYSAIYAMTDFKTGVINNLLAKGYSRNKIFLSKLFPLIITIICTTIYVNLLYFVTGILRYGVVDYPMLFLGIECLLGMALCFITYPVMVFCISYLIRSTSLSVIYATLSYSLVNTIFAKIIDFLFKNVGPLFSFECYYVRNYTHDIFISDFLFNNIFDYFCRLNMTFNITKNTSELPIIIMFYIALTIYPIIVILLSMLINKKMERNWKMRNS